MIKCQNENLFLNIYLPLPWRGVTLFRIAKERNQRNQLKGSERYALKSP